MGPKLTAKMPNLARTPRVLPSGDTPALTPNASSKTNLRAPRRRTVYGRRVRHFIAARARQTGERERSSCEVQRYLNGYLDRRRPGQLARVRELLLDESRFGKTTYSLRDPAQQQRACDDPASHKNLYARSHFITLRRSSSRRAVPVQCARKEGLASRVAPVHPLLLSDEPVPDPTNNGKEAARPRRAG